MLELVSVSKNYHSTEALNNVSLMVGQGKIMALLGPNGAGKTTAIKILAGLIRPDSGEAFVCNYSISKEAVEAKKNLGYLSDSPMLFEYLTGIDYLNLVMDIFRIPQNQRLIKVEKYLDAFDMRGQLLKQIAGYSLGSKKKIALIAALCHEPRTLVLDEPASGLDPKSIKALRDILIEYARKGNTVLFSTHILEIAEKMCGMAAIISKGRVIAEGTFSQLREKTSADSATLEEIFLQITSTEYSRDGIDTPG